ncbi:MAG TPA: adenosylhomocysteinase [Candidatus Polarisedimenticolaceae bacterium]|nr:adenosylhomocysteinase [Candidatus Polarisedimenticolaceae bacterium]
MTSRRPPQADEGMRRIAWAERSMPVLRTVRDRFAADRPLAGHRVAACLHVTPETANLLLALRAAGATVALCASNPLSTQDDVAAALDERHEIPTHAAKGEDAATRSAHLAEVLETRPTLTLDDGADLVSLLHDRRTDLLPAVAGGTEETTTGVIKLRSMAARGRLRYPIVAVNDAVTKQLFDNRHGTGQSTMDGIVRATNVLLAGMPVVVAGYGWVGKGIALRARGLGANVTVCEIDPVAALEACMDGFRVEPMKEAAKHGQVFVTATGSKSVVGEEHFKRMPEGALIANAGHYNVEIDVEALAALAVKRRVVRDMVEEFELADGRRLHLLAGGRLVNMAAGEGHPATIMDMSFANQALSIEYLVAQRGKIEPSVLSVPREIDRHVAALKLKSLGVRIDTLSPEQKRYLASWSEGA